MAARPARLNKMANAQRPELSSVFDEMLAQNKKRFDDLYGSRRPQAGAFATGAAPSAEQGRPAGLSPITAAGTGGLNADSVAVRRLNERFGSDWRYEVANQRRDGDEAIVLCKLIFGKDSAVRTQFGRARIGGVQVSGASGDVRFKFGTADAAQDESDAFRRATEAALMNCADLV